jgi:hypothetical protein
MGDVRYMDPVVFKQYVNEMTICGAFNSKGCRGGQCGLRHVCSTCKSDQHAVFKCKKDPQGLKKSQSAIQ